jgi:hypothetical protein
MRSGPVLAIALALLLGSSVAAVLLPAVETPAAVNGVSGSLVLDPITSLGEFYAGDAVHHHRGLPVTGSSLTTDDFRLSGRVDSTWNYDVHGSGSQPVPAWGTMQIRPIALASFEATDEGAWVGNFTGIQRHDSEPFMVRAFLIGEGIYEGLCATLDIEAGTDGWLVDGVIHPAPMAG